MIFRCRFSLGAVTSILAFGILACDTGGETADSGTEIVTAEQAIFGKGVRDDMTARCGPVSAVALVEISSGTGSGTLVSPTKVVTANHVVAGASGAKVHFPNPDGGLYSEEVDSISPAAPGAPPTDKTGANDIAILTLKSPIPRRIAEPMPIELGDVPAMVASGAMNISWGSLIIGWGGVKYNSNEGAGTRRVGNVQPEWYLDECGDLCEAHCNTVPYWRGGNLDSAAHAMHALGDSGGALTGYSGGYKLIGVISGTYDYDFWCNHEEGLVESATYTGYASLTAWFNTYLQETRTFPAYPSRFSLRDVAAYAINTIRVNDRARVLMPSGGWGNVAVDNRTPNICISSRFGTDIHVGSIWANQVVTLGNRAQAHGTVVAEGRIIIDTGASAGAKEPNVRMAMPQIPLVKAFPTTQISVPVQNSGSTYTVAKSSYIDELTLNGNATVNFPCNGDYYFNRLIANTDSKINIDTSCGLVRIYVRDVLTIRGNTGPRSGGSLSVDRLVWGYFGGAEVVLDSPVTIGGTFVAPYGSVTLAPGKQLKGAIYARTIELHQDSKLWQMPYQYSWN